MGIRNALPAKVSLTITPTKSEEMGRDISHKHKTKVNRNSYTQIKQMYQKYYKNTKKGPCKMIRGSTLEEEITITNTHALYIRSHNYMKQILLY